MLKVSGISLATGETFTPKRLTIVIGPNNGGKSRFLKDISSSVTAPRAPKQSIAQIDMEILPSWQAALDKMASALKIDENGNLIFDRLGVDLTEPSQRRYGQSSVQTYGVNSSRQINRPNEQAALEIFGPLFLAYLDTSGRLKLVDRQTQAPVNIAGPASIAAALRNADSRVLDWINGQVRAAFERD